MDAPTLLKQLDRLNHSARVKAVRDALSSCSPDNAKDLVQQLLACRDLALKVHGIQAAVQLQTVDPLLPLLTSHSIRLQKSAIAAVVKLARTGPACEAVVGHALGPDAVPAGRAYFLKQVQRANWPALTARVYQHLKDADYPATSREMLVLIPLLPAAEVRSLVIGDPGLLFLLSWRQLAVHQPALCLDLMEQALRGASEDDVALTRRWQLVVPALWVLLNNHNQRTHLPRIIDFLERFTPAQAILPGPLKPFSASLVPLRNSPEGSAALLDRLIALLTRPEARSQLLDNIEFSQCKGLLAGNRRVMHALGEARLACLLDAVATSGGAMQMLLLAVPSVAQRGRLFQHARRVTTNPAWLHPTSLQSRVGRCNIDVADLLKALPPRMRDAESQRVSALKFARNDPQAARQLLRYRYFPDVREQMEAASHGATPEARISGLQNMLGSAALMHQMPEHVLQVLQHVAKRIQSEQSPVVTAVIAELALLPPAKYTDEHIDILRQLADNALSAADVSYDTLTSLVRLFVDLLVHCLVHHPTDWQMPEAAGAGAGLLPQVRLCLDILNRVMTTSRISARSSDDHEGLDLTIGVLLESSRWPYDQRHGCKQRLKAMGPASRVSVQQLLAWWLTHDLRGLDDSERAHLVLAWSLAMDGHVHDEPSFYSLVEQALWIPITDEDMILLNRDYHQKMGAGPAAIFRMWLGTRVTRDDHIVQLLQPKSQLDARPKGAFHDTPVSCLISAKSRMRWQPYGSIRLEALEYISWYRTDLLDDLISALEAGTSSEAELPRIVGSKAHWLLRQQERYSAVLRHMFVMPVAEGKPTEFDMASALRQLAQLSATSAADLEAAVASALASRSASDMQEVPAALLFSLPRLDNQ